MTFNALKEKGLPLEKQLRNWHLIVREPYNKKEVNCYSRTRQILMNGIEVEAWNFKHAFSRLCPDKETCDLVTMMRRIEDQQQTTVNWLAPKDQSVLETTLGYEQVAVDLTAWLAQNEPDKYVKETYDFGLLEDFDHLYRYAQWAYMEEGICPNDIVQGKTDIILGRPTQHHHNCNALRLRNPYDKAKTAPQTKINLLTIVSAEQQTHNYYAEHGFYYGNHVLRETYAEIKDVEEEHVTMYESLIDPTESLYEKLLLHEFTEVCNYYTCVEDEDDEKIKKIWEFMLDVELGHLQIAADLFKKYEKRDPEEIIGNDIIIPCRFTSQKEYVTKILTTQIDKRLGTNKDYTYIKELPEDWISYDIQRKANELGSPTESTITIISNHLGRDIVLADKKLADKEIALMEKGLQEEALAPDTVYPDSLQEMIEKYDESQEVKEKLENEIY